MCGKPASTEALVEGVRLAVCMRCSRFGKEIRQRPQPAPGRGYSGKAAITLPSIEFDVLDDAGQMVLKAREALGLSRHELAANIFVSEGELSRIEDGSLKPREQVARKLEHELKIKIITQKKAGNNDEQGEVSLSKIRDHSSSAPKGRGLTLADVVSIKPK